MSSSDGGNHRPWQPPGSDSDPPPRPTPPLMPGAPPPGAPPPGAPPPGAPPPGGPSPAPWSVGTPPPPPRQGVHPVALAGLSLVGTLLAAGLVYLLVAGGSDRESDRESDRGTAGPAPDTTGGDTATSSITTSTTPSTTAPAGSGTRLLLGVQIAVELSLGDLDLIGVEEADCTVERLAEDVDDERLEEVYNRSSAIVAGDDAEAVLDVLDEEEGGLLVEAANSCFDFPGVMEGHAADILGAVAGEMEDVELTDSEAECAATGLLEEVDQYRVALFLYAPTGFEFTTTENRVLTGVIADCVS